MGIRIHAGYLCSNLGFEKFFYNIGPIVRKHARQQRLPQLPEQKDEPLGVTTGRLQGKAAE